MILSTPYQGPLDTGIDTMAGGKGKKKETARSINRTKVEEQRLNTDHQKYVLMVVDPDGEELAKQPALVPRRSTIVRNKIIQDLTGISDFYAEVRPDLDKTLALTRGSALTATNDPWTIKQSGVTSLSARPCDAPAMRLSDNVSVNQSYGSAVYRYAFTSAAGGNVDFEFTNAPTSEDNIKFYLDAYPGPVSSTLGFFLAPGRSTTMTLALPVGTTGVRIRYAGNSQPTGKAFSFVCTVKPQAGVLVGADVGMQDVFKVDTLADVSQMRYFKIVAQELLVSYMGSTLNNGGVVAAARVSGNWAPQASVGDAYDNISRIPYDSYDGRIESGAHVHYTPQSITDTEPQYVGLSLPEPRRKLVVGGRLDDSTQSLRIRVVTVIEYFSDAQSYGEMGYGPPWADFDVYMAIMDAIIPAASSNDDHLKKIRRGVKRLLSKGAASAGSWALEQARNPANWAKLAAMIA